MKVVERRIFKIHPGKMDQVKGLEERFWALESQFGFPPKRRYECLAGPHDSETYIFERDWDSFTVAEAAIQKAFADPRLQALLEEGTAVFGATQMEFYSLLD